ncbi:MAG: tetratricopeptide repeat protein [Saprospiraceae bacterium]
MRFFLFLLPLFLLVSCGDADTAGDGTDEMGLPEIPKLLARPVALQGNVEWDAVQSNYMKVASALRTTNKQGVEPRIQLAQVFINEARVTGEHGHYYPAALKVLNEALELNRGKDPNLEFEALSTKASVELSQHDFASALVTAKKAVALNPYNAQVYGALVDANVELGNYDEAVKLADKMVEIRPDLRSYSRVSYLREIHGDVDGAIAAMDLAVKAGAPGYESTAWARQTMGELYRRYGMPEKAEAMFRAALNDRANYPFAIAGLAELEMDKGNYAQAEKLLDSAAAIIPEVGFYVTKAELYHKQERKEEMKATVAEIMPMLKDDVDSGHNMDLEYATVYRDLDQDYDKALKYAMTEYDKRPENIDVNRMVATILVAQGKKEDAAPYLERAARTKSKHPELVAMQ